MKFHVFVLLMLVGFGAPQGNTRADQPASSAKIVPTVAPAGWEFYRNGELVAGYRESSGGRPVVFPVIGPGGVELTRGFPIIDAKPGEKQDHDHHRSLWLGHGDVNGIDFWARSKGSGRIVQRSAKTETAGSSIALTTWNDWVTPEGDRVLSDVRQFTFGEDQGRHLIDCDFWLIASDAEVRFGDTKEGTFGLRVAATMTVDAKSGGRITNAQGLRDAQAWGKSSDWVDYSGPVAGQTMGITLHEHPSSFGHPCRWHVRSYGLFTANPFGIHHFTGGPKRKPITIPAGQKRRLSYRVILHRGTLDVAASHADQSAYAQQNRPEFPGQSR